MMNHTTLGDLIGWNEMAEERETHQRKYHAHLMGMCFADCIWCQAIQAGLKLLPEDLWWDSEKQKPNKQLSK